MVIQTNIDLNYRERGHNLMFNATFISASEDFEVSSLSTPVEPPCVGAKPIWHRFIPIVYIGEHTPAQNCDSM